MSKSNKKFLEQREIDSMKDLSHYERIQLQLHGNILREPSRHPVLKEMGDMETDGPNTDFQNAIFSQLNPAL